MTQKNQKKTINALFPTAVSIETLDEGLTQEQLDFILNLKSFPNTGNSTSVNTFVLDDPILATLKDKLTQSVQQYVEEVWCPNKGLFPYITQSWVNFTKPGEFHHPHNHPNSLISGVYYVQADPEKDSICFIRDNYSSFSVKVAQYNMFNSSFWYFPTGTNQLILFPSNASHEVKPTAGPETRISLSFNTFFTGEIGNFENLDYLKLG